MVGTAVLALSMGNLVLLAALIIALVLVLRALAKKKDSELPESAPVDLSSLTIREARRGDIVTIRHASPDYEDLNVTVEKIHRYESGGDRWQELEGRTPHGRASIEWEDDDGLQVSLAMLDKTHRIEAAGLTEDELVRFDEEQSSSNQVEFDGVTYFFESSYEVGFFEDGRGQGEGYYSWNFESDDGRHFLTVEKWEGEAFEMLTSTAIRPEDIQVFRK